MIQPAPLKKGDLIYITAPAKAIEPAFVYFAQNYLEKQGFRVEISPNCLGNYNYFSGTDQERLADLQQAIDHPEAKAILCARGGYGCVRIVDQLQDGVVRGLETPVRRMLLLLIFFAMIIRVD